MMLHFIRPYWLLILIPAVIYLTWVVYSRRQRNPWKKICDPHLLPTLLQTSIQKSKLWFNLPLFLFFILSIIALAGPSWKKTSLPLYRDLHSLMIVLDLSPNMLNTDLKPDRLTRAKFKIRDLINATQNTQMGLVVFTREAFVASPLSQDANTLNALLDELNPQMMPVADSDSGQGLAQGLDLLKQAGAAHGNILLITASPPTAASWSAAKNITAAGSRLTILALLESNASNQTTIQQLQQLAQTGGGSFYLFTQDASDIQKIISSNNTKQVIKNVQEDNAYLWQDAGPWVCLWLIPLALIVIRGTVRHEKPL